MNEKEGRNGDDKIRIPREFFSFNRRISQDHDGYLKSGILFAINSRVNPILFLFLEIESKPRFEQVCYLKKSKLSNVKRVFKDFFIKLSPGEYQTVAYHHPLFSPRTIFIRYPVRSSSFQIENWPNFHLCIIISITVEKFGNVWPSFSLVRREMTENGRIESTNRRVERVRGLRFEVHRSSGDHWECQF